MNTATAKLFKHGGSQALRIPKAFRMPGDTVEITRTSDGILVRPVEDFVKRASQFARLAGSCPEFPAISSAPIDAEREPLL
jgi:virulence-associated protein VagC